MIEYLLSASMSCVDAKSIITRIEKQREGLGNQIANELIHEIKNYVPECFNEGSVHNRR